VRIFQQVNDSWQRVGNDLKSRPANSPIKNDFFGSVLDMSSNGSRVAVGAWLNGGGIDKESYTGHVRVYDQPTDTSDNDWIQVGNNINGSAFLDSFGFSLAISVDGTTVVVGAPENNGYGSYTDGYGYARVFESPSVVEPECPLVHCDFATLQVARYLSNDTQKQRLLNACGIVSVTAKNNDVSRNVNVFSSSKIRSTNTRDDPDLGSPNRNCPVKGPGIGIGGGPNATYPNCIAQGNLLIIQEAGNPESRPNDAANGGCM
jgi:hypothetical protein